MTETGSAAFRVAGDTVSVFLTDGSSVVGKVDAFSDSDAELWIDTGELVAERYTTARIGYLALHAGAQERRRAPADAVAYRIHLHNGQTVQVLADRALRVSDVGFRALPVVSEQRYREYFFFSSAVRLRERDEPIGSMLVSAGAIHPEVLEHAIVAQKAHQNTPIGKLLVESLSVSESDLARAVALQKQRNNRLGDLLIEEGLATREQIDRAFSEQQRRKSMRLGEVLLDLDIVSEETLARTLARKFDLEYVNLDALEPEPEAVSALSKEVITRYNVLPIRRTERGLVLAVSDPLSLESAPALEGVRFEQVLATASSLARKIRELVSTEPAAIEDSHFDFIVPSLAAPRPEPAPPDLFRADGSVPPAVARAMLEELVQDACRRGATAVHFEPQGAENVRVRLRVDGVFTSTTGLSATEYAAIRATLPSGTSSVAFQLRDREVSFDTRVFPTATRGEDLILSLMAPRRPSALSELDLSATVLSEVERIAREPSGLFLSAGRPGPLRATLLHAMIARLDTPAVKICSAEATVETAHAGVRPLLLDPSRGVTSVEALRTLLRADPDVILLGALEGRRAARETVEAALGPRLVLAALTGSGAAEALERLLTWDVDPYSLADALLGVHAARLARRHCGACREPYAASSAEERALTDAYGGEELARDFGGRAPSRLELWRTRGCARCNGTGFQGKVALHELFAPSDALRHALGRRAPAPELRRVARAHGARTLVHDALQKALRGEVELRDALSASGA